MATLSQSSLTQASGAVALPAYDRSAVTPGIVHIGIGAFHRAHMASYVDAVLGTDPSWGIIGANLRRPDTKLALEPQDYLYTVAVRDASGTRTRVVGSILGIIDASQSADALIAQMAAPEIRIVSLTVTEKGYCHDGASGALRLDHPDIVRDLANPTSPRSAPGVIVAALQRRRDAGLKGFAVLSCDNLPSNGRVAERVMIEYANELDPKLAAWIAANVTFPSTMVDRIVPATTDQDRTDIAALTGLDDAWPVVTEPFSQWVVEDRFVAGRPAWEAHGVQMADDVEPFEHMKLRMLNGSHSTIAYLGLLAGYELVSEAVGDPNIRALLHRLMTDEVIPTLHLPGVDLHAYRDSLLERFANPALNHRLRQIAMDGSQKLPQRILAPMRDRLAGGLPVNCLTLTVAAWIAQLHDQLGQGREPILDPLNTDLSVALLGGGDTADGLLGSFLALAAVFGDPAQYPQSVKDQIREHLAALLSQTPAVAIQRANAA